MRLLVCLLVLLAPISARTWGQTSASAAPPAAKKAATVSAQDSQIQAAIQAKFAQSKIARNNFKVMVRGGTAVLTGSTDVIQHKGIATRLARSAGARVVDNRIQISENARNQAAQNLAKARKAEVKRLSN